MNKVQNTLLASGHSIPLTKLCASLGLACSSAYYQPRQRKARPIDEAMAARIKRIHRQEPACGVRGTWSRLRFRDGVKVNRKKVHRIMKLKDWTLPKRRTGRRPRVQVSSSIAENPNQRWATDLAMIHCGRDGWCVFVPVIDCCTREVLGHALEFTGRAKTAERALEEALLARFGTLRSAPQGMLLRHDNGLVFGSRRYPRGGHGLRTHSGIHHSLYPSAERSLRTLHQDLQGGVRLDSELQIHRARALRPAGLAPLLQHPTPSPGPQLQNPKPTQPIAMQSSLIKNKGCPITREALQRW